MTDGGENNGTSTGGNGGNGGTSNTGEGGSGGSGGNGTSGETTNNGTSTGGNGGNGGNSSHGNGGAGGQGGNQGGSSGQITPGENGNSGVQKNDPSRPNIGSNASNEAPSTPENNGAEVLLDTKEVDIPLDETYAFLVRGNNDVANIRVSVADENVLSVALDNAEDTRGAKYRITPKAVGDTQVNVTYRGRSATILVHVSPANSLELDTNSVEIPFGNSYAFLVRGNHDVNKIHISVANESLLRVVLDDATDSRGAKYRMFANAEGETEVRVEYEGKTATMRVKILPSNGSMTLDTVYYILAPGQRYTIGSFFRDERGNDLTTAQVRQLLADGKLKVSDSRTGSILDLEQLATGHFRVTARRAGVGYIVYEIGGIHASVRIEVQDGAAAQGQATRSTSYYTQIP